MTDNPFLAAAGIKVAPPVQPFDAATIAAEAEQRYGLPHGILHGLIHVESRGNPTIVSDQGAQGIAQILPGTAKQLGVDPFNPSQAIDGAARYLKEGIDKTGSLEGGLMYYHGGPNQKIWGPKTRAYPGQVLSAMGQQPEGGDPSTDASNPFLAALNGGNTGGDGQAPVRQPVAASGGGGGNPANSVVGGRAGSPVPVNVPAQVPDNVRGGDGAGSAQPDGFFQNAANNVQNLGAGLAHGFVQVPETLAGWTADAADRLGYHDRADRIRSNIAGLDSGTRQLAADPNSDRFAIGNFGGEVAATAPLAEVKLLQGLGVAGKLGAALRIGDLGIQGAAGGALLSRGKDVLKNTVIGGLAAPALGKALEAAAPYAIKAVEGAGNSKLAQALAKTIDDIRSSPEAAAEAGNPAANQTIRTGAQLAETPMDMTPHPELRGNLNVDITPATIPPEALGSRGARTGIEAHDQMTPEVAQAYQKAVADGAAPDEALREADVIANGGNPTAAMVTRNPAMMQAEKEGAKSTSVEGLAINKQIADNNAALHQKAQSIVNEYGGAPAPGDASQTAAESLLKASQAERAKVNSLYEAADAEAAALKGQSDALNGNALDEHAKLRAQIEEQYANAVRQEKAARAEGAKPLDLPPKPQIPPAPVGLNSPGYIDMSPLRKALSDPEYANPTIEGVKTLRSGLLGQLEAYGKGGDMVNLQQAEKLRQAVNQAYDPMGSGINNKVGELKATIDKALDDTSAGPAYQKARAAHKVWAAKYADPKGVANLIRTDAQGNLTNADSWRSVENMVGKTNDKDFLQVVRQLKATGDTDSLNKFKASIVQDAYQYATGRNAGNATDQLGNSTFSGKMFHDRLNKIGLNKLNALFEPDEISRLASLGRAGTVVNEAVPGTVNTSHTASAVENAVRRLSKPEASKAAKAIGIGVKGLSGAGGYLMGGAPEALAGLGGAQIVTDPLVRMVTSGAKRSAANDLAEALKTLTSPSTTRAAERAAQQKLEDAARRAAMARALADQSAPVAASAAGGR